MAKRTEAPLSEPIVLPLKQALEWLQEHASKEDTHEDNKNLRMQASEKNYKKSEASKSKSDRQQQKKLISEATTSSTLPLQMFEIQEEYTEDGRQVSGKAVDISSRLQAVWNHMKQQKEGGEEEYNDEKVDEDDDITPNEIQTMEIDN